MIIHRKRECLPSSERETYINEMRSKGLGHITIGCKNRYIDEFLRFCLDKFSNSDPNRITADQLEDFIFFLLDQPIKKASVVQKIGEIFMWFRWLEKKEKIQYNPVDSLPKLEIKKMLAEAEEKMKNKSFSLRNN